VDSDAKAYAIKKKIVRLNMWRGKGILCKNIMEAQLNSTRDTRIYALFISLIYDEVGSLTLFDITQFLINLIWYF